MKVKILLRWLDEWSISLLPGDKLKYHQVLRFSFKVSVSKKARLASQIFKWKGLVSQPHISFLLLVLVLHVCKGILSSTPCIYYIPPCSMETFFPYKREKMNKIIWQEDTSENVWSS